MRGRWRWANVFEKEKKRTERKVEREEQGAEKIGGEARAPAGSWNIE